MIFTGFASGLLIALVLDKRSKVWISGFSIFLALPLGTAIGFGLIEGSCVIIPQVCNVLGKTGVPDILAVMIISAFVNMIYGIIVLNRKN